MGLYLSYNRRNVIDLINYFGFCFQGITMFATVPIIQPGTHSTVILVYVTSSNMIQRTNAILAWGGIQIRLVCMRSLSDKFNDSGRFSWLAKRIYMSIISFPQACLNRD